MSSSTGASQLSQIHDSFQTSQREGNENGQSPTMLHKTAQLMVADKTLVNQYYNLEPVIKPIRLLPAPLVALFTAIIRPLVYANARNLSVATYTQAADTAILDNIIYSVAVNGLKALYGVLYYKASSHISHLTNLFGPNPETEKFSFPAMMTLLISSAGPVVRERESYRCVFVPHILEADVAAAYADNQYDFRYERTFLEVLEHINYSVVTTSVDINSTESSHWWTLHVTDSKRDLNGNRTAKNVYNPMSFQDCDNATILGAIGLIDTLYEFPGPCHTSRLGPFIARTGPHAFEDIPIHLRSDLSVNESPPVRVWRFHRLRNPRYSDILVQSLEIPNPPGHPSEVLLEPIQRNTIREVHDYTDFIEDYTRDYIDRVNEHRQRAATESQTSKKKKSSTGAAIAAVLGDPRYAPEPHVMYPGLDDYITTLAYGVYECEIYYFDH
jgi:hypothetical protein